MIARPNPAYKAGLAGRAPGQQVALVALLLYVRRNIYRLPLESFLTCDLLIFLLISEELP
jgi:hypothetical protein